MEHAGVDQGRRQIRRKAEHRFRRDRQRADLAADDKAGGHFLDRQMEYVALTYFHGVRMSDADRKVCQHHGLVVDDRHTRYARGAHGNADERY